MSSLSWMTGLKFKTLREANLRRLPEFKNAQGLPAHSEPDGSDWSLGDWMLAVQGELGEAANILKKIKRGDYSLDTVVKTNHDNSIVTVRDLLAKEYADVQTYLDILAFRSGVDLGKATIQKFNEVSARVGSRVKIRNDGTDWEYSE
jgi:NTP pyrophosphatase (non-canonical NTP hydrolase)